MFHFLFRPTSKVRHKGRKPVPLRKHNSQSKTDSSPQLSVAIC
jgi:hypothetical protein